MCINKYIPLTPSNLYCNSTSFILLTVISNVINSSLINFKMYILYIDDRLNSVNSDFYQYFNVVVRDGYVTVYNYMHVNMTPGAVQQDG